MSKTVEIPNSVKEKIKQYLNAYQQRINMLIQERDEKIALILDTFRDTKELGKEYHVDPTFSSFVITKDTEQ